MTGGRTVEADATPGTATLRPLSAIDVSELRSLLRDQRGAYEQLFGVGLAREISGVEAAVRACTLDGFIVGEPRAFGYAFTVRDVASDVLASLWVESGRARVARQLVARVSGDACRRQRRLEAQDLGYGADDLSGVVASFSSLTRRRLYMRGRTRRGDLPTPAGALFRSFREGDLSAAAAVSARAFAQSPDVEFATSYRSLSGCLSRLLLSSAGRSWGPLVRDCSPVALDGSGKMLGFALVTRIGVHKGHLVETAVSPEAQGRGLGRALLKRVVAGAHEQSLHELTLCVTEANTPAMRLYESEGFDVARVFCAHVLATGKPRAAGGQNLPSVYPEGAP